MKNFRIVAKNVSSLTAAEIAMKVIAFFWVIFLARQLGVSGFGKYNFVNAFIIIFSFLPDLGVGLIFIREVAQNRGKANIYLGNCLILNSVLALFAFAFIFISINFLQYPPETVTLVLIAAITLIISTIRSVGVWLFDSFERMEISGFLNTVNTALSITGGFLGLILGFGLKGVFLGMLLGTVLSAILTWSIVLKKFVAPKITLDFSLWKHLTREGLPLALAAFAFFIYTRIDTVMLSKMAGVEAVGWYNAATVFTFSAIQFFNVPLVSAIYPTLSRLLTSDKLNFPKIVRKLLIFVLLWSFPLTILATIFAPVIIKLFYGANFSPSIAVLRIVIWFVPFASMSAILYKALIILKKQKIYLYISLFGSLLNVALNLFFIPRNGILGAAISSVTTQIIIFGIYFTVVFKELGLENVQE